MISPLDNSLIAIYTNNIRDFFSPENILKYPVNKTCLLSFIYNIFQVKSSIRKVKWNIYARDGEDQV